MRTLLILAAILPAAPAAAANLAAGRAIAARCKECHAIGLKDASPDPHAAPFRALAKKYPLENLQEGLAEGIVVGHSDGMPRVKLSPAQIAAFLAYLRSIQR